MIKINLRNKFTLLFAIAVLLNSCTISSIPKEMVISSNDTPIEMRSVAEYINNHIDINNIIHANDSIAVYKKDIQVKVNGKEKPFKIKVNRSEYDDMAILPSQSCYSVQVKNIHKNDTIVVTHSNFPYAGNSFSTTVFVPENIKNLPRLLDKEQTFLSSNAIARIPGYLPYWFGNEEEPPLFTHKGKVSSTIIGLGVGFFGLCQNNGMFPDASIKTSGFLELGKENYRSYNSLGHRYSLGLGINGWKHDNKDYTFGNIFTKYHLTYNIYSPLMRYRWQMGIGAYARYAIGGEIEYDDDTTTSLFKASDMKRFDAGISAIATWKGPKYTFLAIEYQRGLLPLFTAPQGLASPRSNAFYLTFGFNVP